MEVLFVVALGVALFWALSAKRTSQQTARYHVHKDALTEAARFLERYTHSPGLAGEDDSFDVSVADLEVREFLASDLEELAFHVRTTRVPTDLGKAELLRELLEALGRTRVWSDGPLRPVARRELRQRVMDGTFEQLRNRLETFDSSSFVRLQLEVLSSILNVGRDALKWNIGGTRVAVVDAKRLIADGERLLRQNDYGASEEEV